MVLATNATAGSDWPPLPAYKAGPSAELAFERVTKNALGASHVQLQRALAAEARSYAKSLEDVTKHQLEEHAAVAVEPAANEVNENQDDTIEDDEVEEDVEAGNAGN